MANYQLDRLNDKEFEILACDIISTIENVRVERFKAGKDQGIDGRFFTDTDEKIIIQCKHWIKSSISVLKAHLRSKESEKVKKLQPARYILFISNELNPQEKDEISSYFSPFLHVKDIFGYQDIEDILNANESLLRKHYKLWLTSAAVLSSILHNDVYSRSKLVIQKITEFANKYVITDHHNEAIHILNEKNVVVVTGDPGVGKTTLAEAITLPFIKDGYELVVVEKDITDAENVYQEDKKQLFYFDDFIGQNLYDVVNGKDNSRVLNFIKRIENKRDKKFVLTSRVTILASFKANNDKYRLFNMEKSEYVLEVKNISKLDKAQILYNHIYFSNLEDEFVEEIYKNNRYMDIIKHSNFNPRLISFITSMERLTGVGASDYWKYTVNILNKPSELWDFLFKKQIDSISQHIVLFVVLNRNKIEIKMLRKSIRKFYSENQQHLDTDAFNESLKICLTSLLNKIMYEDSELITLYNPSIADFVLNHYKDDDDILMSAYKALANRDALEYMVSLSMQGYFSKQFLLDYCQFIVLQLVNGNIDPGENEDSMILAIALHQIFRLNVEVAVCFIKTLNIDSPRFNILFKVYSYDLFSLLGYIVLYGIDILSMRTIDLFIDGFLQEPREVEITKDFTSLFDYLPGDLKSKYTSKFKENVMLSYKDEIKSIVDENDGINNYYDENDYSLLYNYIRDKIITEELNHFSCQRRRKSTPNAD